MRECGVTSTPGPGPFFHGTRAVLRPGDELVAGHASNYRPEVIMNHVYVTALTDGAGLAAEIAVILGPEGSTPHVYEVRPTGPLEDDPNVTDKKYPGNPTRSFRSAEPMVVVREVTTWKRLTPEERETWRGNLERLLGSDAPILN